MSDIIRLISWMTFLIVGIGGSGFLLYVGILIVTSLRKYLKEKEENVRGLAERQKDMDTGKFAESQNEADCVKISLGETLKLYRMKCRMTQEYVAQQIGVSRQAVSKWENGTSEPSTSNLFALARLFEVETGVLLKNRGAEN
uniref:helix-turn-helix transcriptional regulator n=1 Tax=Agathobacter sp. TaxID=2021311 RepID=UPI00405643CD